MSITDYLKFKNMYESGRSQIQFTRMYENGLHILLNIVRPEITPEQPLAGLKKELYTHRLNCYLEIAQHLLSGLDSYIIVRSIPDLYRRMSMYSEFPSLWQYYFEANDLNGLGIDHGFIRCVAGHVILKTDILKLLTRLPEDTLGEEVLQFTILGLAHDHWKYLEGIFLQEEQPPILGELLLNGEIFINITVSKSLQYYHTMLITSRKNIERKVDAYQFIISSDN